jgi:hypothetical protein
LVCKVFVFRPDQVYPAPAEDHSVSDLPLALASQFAPCPTGKLGRISLRHYEMA